MLIEAPPALRLTFNMVLQVSMILTHPTLQSAFNAKCLNPMDPVSDTLNNFKVISVTYLHFIVTVLQLFYSNHDIRCKAIIL